jgi:hypothetical protein
MPNLPPSTAGYSKRPLIEKLGIKAGYHLAILQPPADYAQTLGALPVDVVQVTELSREPLDFVHFFTTQQADLVANFPALKASLKAAGMLWISWPKRTAKLIPSDLDENMIRDIGLSNGLVDVKVAAIDATWSGLKFVYRLQDRK